MADAEDDGCRPPCSDTANKNQKMSLKRKEADAAADTAATSKRLRSVIDESLEEFLCPITHGLPLEPVLAEDGKVYEQSAIQMWLTKQQRSPVTNEAMGNKLVSATPIKNMIERVVESDALVGHEKVVEWKQRIEQYKVLRKVRRAAEAGDVEAISKIGIAYANGTMGLDQDIKQSRAWLQKGTEGSTCKHAHCMAYLAQTYYDNWIDQNHALALRWASAATALGSNSGRLVLGHIYMDGDAGIPVDKEKGFELYRQGLEHLHGCVEVSPKAYYTLGTFYCEGKGTAIDMDKATKWMLCAVKSGLLGSPVRKLYVDLARAWLEKHGKT